MSSILFLNSSVEQTCVQQCPKKKKKIQEENCHIENYVREQKELFCLRSRDKQLSRKMKEKSKEWAKEKQKVKRPGVFWKKNVKYNIKAWTVKRSKSQRNYTKESSETRTKEKKGWERQISEGGEPEVKDWGVNLDKKQRQTKKKTLQTFRWSKIHFFFMWRRLKSLLWCVWCFTRRQQTSSDEFYISCCVYDVFACFMTFCHVLFAAAALLALEMNFPAGWNKVDLLLSNLPQYEERADRFVIKCSGIRVPVTSVAPDVQLEPGCSSAGRPD